jgi:GAF domain-containing protein
MSTTPDAPRPPVEEMTPAEAFEQLGRIVLTDAPLERVMTRIGELARASVPGADEVSVTLVEHGRPRTVAFTNSLAVHLDERQYARGFGPCTDAAISGQTIEIHDTLRTGSYVDFAEVCARAGVRSTLSVPMPTQQRAAGALNLYATVPDAFDGESVHVARAFADYAAVALMNAALVDSQATLAKQLHQAMATRAVIEQAKGVLMARHGLDAEAAFAQLVQESQRANRKLHTLAAELVAQVTVQGSGSAGDGPGLTSGG